MDRVTIMLQNKQLIEELINSSDETKAKIHAAIIDGVSKRIVKNVVTNMDSSVSNAIEKAQEELMLLYMDKFGSGWNNCYKLKPKYSETVRNSVRNAWNEEISKSVKEWIEHVESKYKERLERAYAAYIDRIEYLTANLEDEIKKAVDANISKRLGGTIQNY